MIFQGQEFLEDDWFHDQDPIDWTKKDRFAGIVQLYKNLISLRVNRDGRTKGLSGQEISVYHINEKDKMMAYHRWESAGPHDSVVVVVNFSTQPRGDYVIGLPAAGEWVVRFNSDSRYYDGEFGDFGSHSVETGGSVKDGLPAQGTISVAPYSALILSQEPS